MSLWTEPPRQIMSSSHSCPPGCMLNRKIQAPSMNNELFPSSSSSKSFKVGASSLPVLSPFPDVRRWGRILLQYLLCIIFGFFIWPVSWTGGGDHIWWQFSPTNQDRTLFSLQCTAPQPPPQVQICLYFLPPQSWWSIQRESISQWSRMTKGVH